MSIRPARSRIEPNPDPDEGDQDGFPPMIRPGANVNVDEDEGKDPPAEEEASLSPRSNRQSATRLAATASGPIRAGWNVNERAANSGTERARRHGRGARPSTPTRESAGRRPRTPPANLTTARIRSRPRSSPRSPVPRGWRATSSEPPARELGHARGERHPSSSIPATSMPRTWTEAPDKRRGASADPRRCPTVGRRYRARVVRAVRAGRIRRRRRSDGSTIPAGAARHACHGPVVGPIPKVGHSRGPQPG